ncbi:MAG: hypothetical protein ACK4R7_02425 [Fervidobacterium sp.]
MIYLPHKKSKSKLVRPKFIIFLLVLFVLLFSLSSCAFLISNFISGTGQSSYVAYVYLNSIPKEVIENTNAQSLDELHFLAYSFSINFKVLDQLNTHSESYNTSDSNIVEIRYLVNGFNKSSPIEFIAKNSDKITLDASLTISYATSTTFPIEQLQSNISFLNVLRDTPNSRKFYVLVNAVDESNKDITILDYNQGYKIIIETPKEEIIRILGFSNSSPDFYLFTKSVGTKNQCVFIGKRGETYNIYSLSSGATRVITVPIDTSKESEILELK